MESVQQRRSKSPSDPLTPESRKKPWIFAGGFDYRLAENLQITSTEVLEAMREPITSIVESIKLTLEKTPPELASEVMDKGIMLTGGGALLDGMDRLVQQETGMPVRIADNPLDCVVLGAAKALDEIETLKRVAVSTKNFR